MAKAFGVEQESTDARIGRVSSARSAGASGSGGRVAQTLANTVGGITAEIMRTAKDRRAGRDIASITEKLAAMRTSGVNKAERTIFYDKAISDLTKRRGAAHGELVRRGTSVLATKQVHNTVTKSFDIVDEDGTVLGSRPETDLMDQNKAHMMEMARVAGEIDGEMPKTGDAFGTSSEIVDKAGKQFAGQSEMMRHLQDIAAMPRRVDQSTMRIAALSKDVSLSGNARKQFVTDEYRGIMDTVAGAMQFYINGKREELLKDNRVPYDQTLVEHNLSALKSEAHQMMIDSGFLDAAGISKAEARATLDGFAEAYSTIARTALETERASVENGIAIVKGNDLMGLIQRYGTGQAVPFITEKLKALSEYNKELNHTNTITDPGVRGAAAPLIASELESASAYRVRRNMATSVERSLNGLNSAVDVSTAYAITTAFLKDDILRPGDRSGMASVLSGYWTAALPDIEEALSNTGGMSDAQAKEVVDTYRVNIKIMESAGKGIDPVKFIQLIDKLASTIKRQ